MEAEENFFPKDLRLDFEPFHRHFTRYHNIIGLLGKTGKGESWLDCACGSGYGTSILSNYTNKITGYDINKYAIEYANKMYSNNNCHYTTDLESLGQFDVIISVETIEHMSREDGVKFLNTLHSKLNSKNGIMLITTPIVNRTNTNPKNKFHVIEYSHFDFIDLLSEVGFQVTDNFFVETTFTDLETKDQGYYKCIKN